MPDTALGIDTSNYTTSAAVIKDGRAVNFKMLLPVKNGEKGIRQSDAVFLHVKQIGSVIDKAFKEPQNINVIGVSDRPTENEGSYMPCFLVGFNVAKSIALVNNVPLEVFTHQQGHIGASLYSAGRLDLLEKQFIAFHISGGTTEALLVSPDFGENHNNVITCKEIARSLDLKAGQAIDRTGVMLGLNFPAGAELEKLALLCADEIKYKISMKGINPSLSGIENQCRDLFNKGAPFEYIAKYTITAISTILDKMVEMLITEYKDFPILFSGGVSSNSIIRNNLKHKYGALFASPEFSSDNASGVAILAMKKRGML